MKLALISDIHGNSIALDAVLADIQSLGGVDGYLFGGDYCAIGFDPAGVLQRLLSLPNATFIRGNTDRYVVNLNDHWPSFSETETDPQNIKIVIKVTRSFCWTLGAVSAIGCYDWLRDLPLDYRLTLPNGDRLLLVHASPGTDDGRGVRRDHSDAELAEILTGCDAEIVVTGHTHIPLDKQIGDTRLFNLGSVSNPHMPDLKAWYAILHANEEGYRLERRQVEYDHESVITAIRASSHPTPEFLVSYFELKQISNIFKQSNLVENRENFDL